jgi:hypothetical protein
LGAPTSLPRGLTGGRTLRGSPTLAAPLPPPPRTDPGSLVLCTKGRTLGGAGSSDRVSTGVPWPCIKMPPTRPWLVPAPPGEPTPTVLPAPPMDPALVVPAAVVLLGTDWAAWVTAIKHWPSCSNRKRANILSMCRRKTSEPTTSTKLAAVSSPSRGLRASRNPTLRVYSTLTVGKERGGVVQSARTTQTTHTHRVLPR